MLIAVTIAAFLQTAEPFFAWGTETCPPARTWAFVAGILEWEHADTWEPFPIEGRRDRELVELLRARGVPADHLVALHDGQATRARLEAALAAQLARVGPRDAFVFYFAGHGQREGPRTWLIPHDCGPDWAAGGWSTRAIVDRFEQSFGGRAVLFAVDCCHSGALLEELAGRDLSFAVAGLASAAPRCASTERWTFTELLLEGLRGSRLCDADGDGSISMAELGGHVQAGMAYLEQQMAPFHAAWNPRVARATLAPAPRAGERCEVLQDGEWLRARVHEARAGGEGGERLLVHYAGWGCDEDEWVGPARLRPWRAPAFTPGEELLARRDGRWLPATVLEVRQGLVRTRFSDRPASRGAWLPPARLRRPPRRTR